MGYRTGNLFISVYRLNQQQRLVTLAFMMMLFIYICYFLGMAQTTATYGGVEGTLAAKGRHDPCVLPRAVPIVEAMASLVICEQVMNS